MPCGYLQPIPTPAQPMDLIAIDTVVMGSVANKTKAKHILVAIDHHSRFMWAKAVAKNDSATA
ncbi:hypothetical protein B4U80_15062, partial [Leptotrombidium deliense]